MIKINGIELNFTQFPNGETCFPSEQINKSLESFASVIKVFFKYENDSDIFKLIAIVDHIKTKTTIFPIILEIPYFPYSRMDRSEQGHLFSLKSFAKIINDLKVDKVISYEIHSDVTPALINKFENINFSKRLATKIFKDFQLKEDNTLVMYPDAGAEKRYKDFVVSEDEEEIIVIENIVGLKKRKFNTNEILSYSITGGENIKDKDIIIIDDLCSKGGTFFEATKKLKELGANNIYLAITHCEYNIINGELLYNDDIKAIYCTDSIIKQNALALDKIKIFNKNEI